jgi:anti-sigma B factor antagonist
MTIEIINNEDASTIKVNGRLDTTTAPMLDKTINEDVAQVKNLVLDFGGVEYISSAGLRVLLGAQKKMQLIGSMKLVGVCEEVMSILEMTGFADILVIE